MGPFKLEHLGEWIVGGALAFIGWVLRTFTNEHLSTMKQISSDISEMRSDISVLKDHATRTDQRLERLEE